MTNELLSLIEKVKERITDESDVVPTGYNSAKELRDKIDICVSQFKSGI